jgi:hypothetical protein
MDVCSQKKSVSKLHGRPFTRRPLLSGIHNAALHLSLGPFLLFSILVGISPADSIGLKFAVLGGF